MLEEFTKKLNLPFMHGVYLGINAIKDAYLLVDSPNCAFFKAEYIFGNHDLFSTLLDVKGNHRILNTDLHVDKVILGHEDRVLQKLKAVFGYEKSGAVFLTAMPMAYITGIQYDTLIDRVKKGGSKPIIHVPGRSLDAYLFDGYSDFLKQIAMNLELESSKKKKGRVGIVGYFFDRNEHDHTANIKEIKRLLASFDLEVSSIWLSGSSFEELKKIEEAETVIAFPYGKEAAKIIAQKTGSKVILLNTPFGIEATISMLKHIGEHFGKKGVAKKVIDENLKTVVPELKWAIPKRFLFKKVAYFGDPYLAPGFVDICTTLGMEPELIVLYSRKVDSIDRKLQNYEVFWEVKEGILLKMLNKRQIDVVVSNSFGMNFFKEWSVPKVEFGFPSFSFHALYDSPFLGFSGFLAFVMRMYNAIGTDSTVKTFN